MLCPGGKDSLFSGKDFELYAEIYPGPLQGDSKGEALLKLRKDMHTLLQA